MSVMSTFSSESDIIRLNGKFGQLLGLKDGEVVAVTQIQSDVASVKRVQVHCESEEDWDILVSLGWMTEVTIIIMGVM